MPCDQTEYEDDFISYLAKLNETSSTPYEYFEGDFNADVLVKPNCVSRFGKLLLDCVKDENFVLYDYDNLDKDSYTFVSSAHNSVSWLDHCVCSATGSDLINNVHICREFVSSTTDVASV